MRLVLTSFLWLVTTITLALALPVIWVQTHLVDTDGYAAFSQRVAADPTVQQAMAAELTAQASGLASTTVAPAVIGRVASAYTASPSFPAQFAQVNRFAHRWLFTDTVRSDLDPQGRWVVDLAPMLRDSSFHDVLTQYNITVPQTLPVPLTDNAPAHLRPGQLQKVATWGPWASGGLVVLAGVCALLTLATARRRGKALTALGMSALLVGGAGWAGMEIGRRHITNALTDTSGDIRQIADSLVDHAISSMHHWLNITLLAGAALVALGIVVSFLTGLGHRSVRQPSGH